MLGFLRKNQKLFFLLTTIFVTLSMVFFGTGSGGRGEGRVKDKTSVFTTKRGTDISRYDMMQMLSFLTEKRLQPLRQQGLLASIHDGVIEKDFLQTGLFSVLLQKYGSYLQDELKEKTAKEKSFHLYKHVNMPVISVRALWDQSFPELGKAYDQFKTSLSSSPVDKEAFFSRAKLYLLSQAMPAFYVKRVLLYQQNLFASETPDPYLNGADLSLFAYHDAEDWFGEHFVHLVAQSVFEFAEEAEARGIKVSDQEALLDLSLKVRENYQVLEEHGGTGSANYVEYFSSLLERMALSEKEATNMWKKVLLFRKLLAQSTGEVFADTHALKRFHRYAGEKVHVELYQLPSSLQLSSMKDKQLLHAYLLATTGKAEADSLLSYEKDLLSLEDLGKKSPELVQRQLSLELRFAALEDLMQNFPLRAVQDWQAQEKNWQLICQENEQLPLKKGASLDARVKALASLSLEDQEALELFARKQMAKESLSSLKDLLEAKPLESETVVLYQDLSLDSSFNFEDQKGFVHFLSNLKEGQEAVWKDKNHTHYQVKLAKDSPWKISSFAEAVKSGALERLISNKVASHYEVKKASGNASAEYKNAEGQWKSLKEVKESLLASLYKLPKDKAHPSVHTYMEALHKKFTKEESLESFVHSSLGEQASSLKDQWKLEKQMQAASRGRELPYTQTKELLGLDVGSSSSLLSQKNGNMLFFRVMEKEEVSTYPSSLLLREPLVQELKRKRFNDLLDDLGDEHALTTSYVAQKEHTS